MLESAAMTHGTDAHDGDAPASRRPLRSYYAVSIVLGLAILLDLGLGWRLYQFRGTPSPSDPPGVQTFASPEPAPHFQLADQNGQPFTRASLEATGR